MIRAMLEEWDIGGQQEPNNNLRLQQIQ